MPRRSDDSDKDKKPQRKAAQDNPKEEETLSPEEQERKMQKQIRVVAVLLFCFSILLFLALVSYSSADEANTQLSFKEFFGLLIGDAAIKAKFEITQNWLGVVGAVISHFLYLKTIGYSLIFLPFFLILWAKNLFIRYSLTDEQIKRTVAYLIVSTLFAAIMGTFLNFPATKEIPLQWSGAIGQFIASVISGLIGNIGTLILLFALVIVTLIFGTNINFDKLIHRSSPGSIKAFLERIRNFKNRFIVKKEPAVPTEPLPEESADQPTAEPAGNPFELPQSQPLSEEVPLPRQRPVIRQSVPSAADDDEPAIIIRRNVNMNIGGNTRFGVPITPETEKKAGDEVTAEIRRVTLFGDEKHLITPQKDSAPQRPEPADSAIEPEGTFPEEAEVYEEPTAAESIPLESTDTFIDSEDDFPSFPVQSGKKTLTVTLNDMIEEELPEGDSDELSADERINLLSDVGDEVISYSAPKSHLLIEQEEYEGVNEDELAENAKTLQEKLETFKIYIENLTVTPGPVVTQYEFVPAAGIKISRIESLADDMAMALKAPGIRILAPIPGKGTVGIEIPNRNPSLVRVSSIIKSQKFYNNEHKLPLALGKTIDGEVFCADLAKMPHLLMAGSTGSGKSVGINTVISSLLFKVHPKDLKFVIVDPKKVELKLYSSLEKHFLAKSPDITDTIITNPQDAVVALKAVCAEMDNRYDILSQVGQRNIADYNANVLKGKYTNDKDMVHRPMPYIVVIIDELADLMLTASKEVEAPIIRIAQLARAVGIHMIIATQRPSVDVITGIIKANFPARLSYLVASKIDSRTILDQSGAEQLLGNGDMLFLSPNSPKPIRIQNAFISTDEVESICEFIGNQKGYSMPYILPSLVEKSSQNGSYSKEDRDPLFEDAARMVVSMQMGSVSLIQRRLKVGYARAGRIVDELEAAGVIGPYDGSKARAVLMESESELEAVL